MRRRSNIRLWTLLLMLALLGPGVATAPRVARADLETGQSPSPQPPDTGIGDPDFPTNTGRMPKPGPQRGAAQQPGHADIASVRSGQLSMWWMGFRMAIATVFRGFFRP